MLIGNVLEKSSAQSAMQLCADKLADSVRSTWQEHRKRRDPQWDEGWPEDPIAMGGLREEGFKGLVGMDYILKWWGAKDSEDLAGVLEVIWKVAEEDAISCYRTWIKLSEQDFILGLYREEGDKREKNREAFREAFAQWHALFQTL